MSICKVVVTKTVAREGAFSGDVVSVKYFVADHLVPSMQSLWVGLFARGKGATLVPEVRLEEQTGVLEVSTAGVSSSALSECRVISSLSARFGRSRRVPSLSLCCARATSGRSSKRTPSAKSFGELCEGHVVVNDGLTR